MPLYEHDGIYFSVNLLVAANLYTLMKDNWYLGKWQPNARGTLDRAHGSETTASSRMPGLGNAAMWAAAPRLRDLCKKTLRGQIGQKQRGFSIGERTYGYRSAPVGEMRIDKRGQPRADSYRMEINPAEAAVVLRIFQQYSDGASLPSIVRSLNKGRVPWRVRATPGWAPATGSWILDNAKCVGRWVWNTTENRRDPHRQQASV